MILYTCKKDNTQPSRVHLIREEKKNTHVYVGHVEDTKEYLPIWAFNDDEEGEIDFLAYHSLDTTENYFDSKKEE